MIEEKANDVHWAINYIKTNWSIMIQIPEILIGLPVLSWIGAKFYYKGRIDSKAGLLEDREKEVELLEKKKIDLESKLKSANAKIGELGAVLINVKSNQDNDMDTKAKYDAFSTKQESPLKIEFKGIFSKIESDNFESYQTYWCEIYNPSDEPVKNVSVSLIYNQEHPLKYQRHGDKPKIDFNSGDRERVDLISCGKINSVPKQQIIIEGDGTKIWANIDLGYLFKVKVTAKGYRELIKEFGFSIKGDKQPPDFKVYPG